VTLPNWLYDLGPILSVVLIDLTLAGDNAIVVAAAAAGLPAASRKRVIFWGIVIATVVRILLATIAVRLLHILGLTLAGGLLLLWVAWGLYREIRHWGSADARSPGAAPAPKSFARSLSQVAAADIAMSLDNVLAIAGAARDNYFVLAAGLVFSVGLMGLAANFIAGLLERHRWIAWLGLLVVLGVALRLIYDGSLAVVRQAT
jgi:YjbE family integral membrane protein